MIWKQLEILRERMLGILVTAGMAAAIAFLTTLTGTLGADCNAGELATSAGGAGAALRGLYQLAFLSPMTHGA